MVTGNLSRNFSIDNVFDINDYENSYVIDSMIKYEGRRFGAAYNGNEEMIIFPQFFSDFEISPGQIITIDEIDLFKGKLYYPHLDSKINTVLESRIVRNVILEKVSYKDFRTAIGHFFYEGEKAEIVVVNTKFKMQSKNGFSTRIKPCHYNAVISEFNVVNDKKIFYSNPFKFNKRNTSNEVFIINNRFSNLKDYDFSILKDIFGYNSFFVPDRFLFIDNGEKYMFKRDGSVLKTYDFLVNSAKSLISSNQEISPGSQNIIFCNNILDIKNLESKLFEQGINHYDITSLFLK
ncbi:MAG: hypothetical protein PHT94_04515 [Candidatus Nanoarchaeia archaeon]|nr:hypothetical protein [Candidatus Nanoarchaeia archaeon]